MNYMYSLNANNGQSTLTIDFDIRTDPNTDQILAQMRQSQAASQLPTAVNNYGVIVQTIYRGPHDVVRSILPRPAILAPNSWPTTPHQSQ